MKKLLFLILSISTLTMLTSSTASKVSGGLKEIREKNRYTFLICGYDDAAENTDVIVVFDYDLSKNIASFIQIPRDTYVNGASGNGKINSLFSSLRASGVDRAEAMAQLSSCLSDIMGVSIDGYAGYTIKGLERFIDNIGGIELNMPYDYTLGDGSGHNYLELKKGMNHLSGSDAVKFVRYRQGYALGDLGRVDAQKIFLASFINQIRHSINFSTSLKLLFDSGDGVYTNCRAIDVINIALKIRGRLMETYVRYANLPGRAVEANNGTWYYLVNRVSSLKMLEALGFSSVSGFDSGERLVNRDTAEFEEIYYADGIEWRIYDDDSLSSIKIYEK